MKKNITLIATAAMGLESVVAKEVKDLGYEPTVQNGRVLFSADVSAIPRCNLWLRTADRVKLLIGEFKAKSFDELFENTKALNWEDFIPENGEFPVIGKSVKSTLHSVPDCQSIVKKAIVERLKNKYGIASWLEETGSLYRIEVALHKDLATLTIDASGSGLHRRGYRVGQGEAPLKETLAAALVLLTNWRANDSFVDPFCGSGTIPIEAALIGQNIAPGFNRSFASEKWNIVPSTVWDKAYEEIEDLANYDQPLDITGSDIDQRMVEISKNNAIEAGLGDLVTWKQMQAKDFNPKQNNGYIIGNPPYGERIGDRSEVEKMYKEFGAAMKNHPSWSIYILTSNENFESLFGRKATKKRKLFNGFIRTDYYQYFGKRVKEE
ncbi:THUMP domain-containing class I SAM-dependent RNA methyltransferase [Aquibacillus albus]|uniref:N6-adenine-specific DNA methylase n=1 Tax=Aquibacillus albus TaxID=1168171 RepID=A0ABS2MVE4_9BACI|nr:class I SAM-dependent RNA methyltransferase [Aquibacillus albus]MBM7569871.1 putative N6-adenine-specific DNA methylase [Aquibacillus albus]